MPVNPYVTLCVALCAGGLGGAVFTRMTTKNEFELSATSCSETGPETVWMENIDTGYKVQIPNAEIATALDRVTNVVNSGSKMIDGESIDLSVDNKNNADIFEYILFFESPLSKHSLEVVDLPNGGKLFHITLKQFNPNDRISLLSSSSKQVEISAISKGNGFTFASHFGKSSYCKYFNWSGYGGAIAYKHFAQECNPTGRGLDMRCEKILKYKVPEDFPPGRARLIFK